MEYKTDFLVQSNGEEDAGSASQVQESLNGRQSLDPTDWDAFRSLAHEVIDRGIDYLSNRRALPAWQAVPDEAKGLLEDEAPMDGVPLATVVDDFFKHILPYPTGNTHPRFWGWVGGAGTPGGVVAETLSAFMNSVPGNFNDAPARVEDQVLDWMRQVIGFPEGSSGVLTSGGSVANLIGLVAGRDARAGYDTVLAGVNARPGELVLYASTEVHSSVIKAAQLMGLGRKSVRLVDVNAAREIDVDVLEQMIVHDREAGRRPFAVVGTAGTVNTGAVDDLSSLAEIARRYDLWFHVDGAFGALVALSPTHRHVVSGMERADSVAFDFHKWMSVQYDAGCVLVRDAEAHRRPFAVAASYLQGFPRGTAARSDTANIRGPQLSRSFRALKVWMTIREHGLRKFGRIVDQNIHDAQHLARIVDEAPDFELLAPAALNVVAFRYAPPGLSNEELNDLNRELVMQIQESGFAVPSSTVLSGNFAIRVANVNHRSIPDDFDRFVSTLRTLGERELRSNS